MSDANQAYDRGREQGRAETEHKLGAEIERLRQIADGRSSALTQHRAQIERLRAREAQAKTIILAAGVYVPEHGGWQAIWHRDADKWVGNEHAGSKPC